jgi:hypothetical protein
MGYHTCFPPIATGAAQHELTGATLAMQIWAATGNSPENLHGRLRVWIVCWLEAQLLQAQTLEEGMQSADEVTECEATVAYETLNLVEFCQMGSVYVLIAEHPINREVLCRPEAFLGKAVQHA